METIYKRKLASVQTIDNIFAHGNADLLEIVIVMGWQVIVKKNEFKIGDKIIYLEIDSVCPKCEWSLFLEKVNFRIKSIKIRGQLSQGLVLPMSVLPNGKYNVGDDVTTELSVTKHDPEQEDEIKNLANTSIRLTNFPAHLGFIKTEEPRIQSNKEYLDLFRNKKWYASLKYDGTSCTYYLNPENGKLAICSRNNLIHMPYNEDGSINIDEIEKSKSVHLMYAVTQDVQKKLSLFPHLVLQGEIFGSKINGNKLMVSDLQFVVFSIFDMNKKLYSNLSELRHFCEKMNLNMVDIVYSGDNFDFDIPQLLDLSKGYYVNTKNHREGIVVRLQDCSAIDGKRYSFKVINNDYLL